MRPAATMRTDRRWLAILGGLLYIAAGVLLFVHPLIGIVSLTILLAWMLIVSGAFRLAAAISGEVQTHRFLAGISGLVSVFVGGFVLFFLPEVSLWMVGLFFGVDMLFMGFAMFGLSRSVKAFRPPAMRTGGSA